MPVYSHVASYDAAVEDVWAWYDSPGAFRRIMPEWEGDSSRASRCPR